MNLKCPVCGETDRKQFGISRRRKTGRNLYCRSCARSKSYAARDRKKEIKQVQTRAQERAIKELAELGRKPNVPSPMIQKQLASVRTAIRNGHKTRYEIKLATKLPLDEVVDALAILMFDEEEIELKRIKGEAYFFEKAA